MRQRAKALIFGAAMRLGLGDLILRFWRLQGQDISYLQHANLSDRFSDIYRKGVWRTRNTESLSGTGSATSATKSLRAGLAQVVTRKSIASILDVGCGDYNWMSSVALAIPYIGVDLVPEVIANDNRRFGDDKRTFLCLNACADELPATDAALAREVLFHLSFADGLALLRNVRRSTRRFLLATTDPSTRINSDIVSGGWREINLSRPPYSLGEPLIFIPDGEGDNSKRVLGVWQIDTLPE